MWREMGRGRKGGSNRKGWILQSNPPGECLQNLITLNGITLLDLWMDVSLTPSLCCYVLTYTLQHPHLQQLPWHPLVRLYEKWQGGCCIKGSWILLQAAIHSYRLKLLTTHMLIPLLHCLIWSLELWHSIPNPNNQFRYQCIFLNLLTDTQFTKNGYKKRLLLSQNAMQNVCLSCHVQYCRYFWSVCPFNFYI